MADLKIEVPISVKGGGVGAGAGSTKATGEKMAESFAKKTEGLLKGIGVGGKGGKDKDFTSKMVKAGSIIGAGVVLLAGLVPMLKPILNLVKIIGMLLFLPLIPIFKPTLQALAAFIKWFAPVMKKVSKFVEASHALLVNMLQGFLMGMAGVIGSIFKGLGEAWEFIKSAGMWLWENIILPGFEIFLNFGVWIWEQIILPGLLFIGDLGIKIWEVIKSLFIGVIDVPGILWGFIKNLFKGTIDVVSSVFSWFKGLFKGTIDVAKTVWDWFKGLFGGKGGGGDTAADFISRPGMALQKFSPNDTIIGVKDPSKLGGGGSGQITININNPSVRSGSDIKQIANEVSRVLQRQMSGRISAGI